MAKRRLRLPNYDELTKEQDAAIALPLNGQHLVVGGPGTGKSVVALYRALIHKNEGTQLFLTYNHVLCEYCSQLIEKSAVCDTAIAWFCNKFRELIGEGIPTRELTEQEKASKKDMDYAFDYDKICEKYEESGIKKSDFENVNILIDEGQDLPAEYYATLDTMGCKNFFITADQNQQIRENENSTVKDLASLFGLRIPKDNEPSGPGDVLYLSENHRNTAPIARLANYFYTDRSSPVPQIPAKPSVNTPVLYEYGNVDDCVKMILREADRDPSLLIGVIVAIDLKRTDYQKRLQQFEIQRDNPPPKVTSYSWDQKGRVDIDYSEGGIVVLCDKSVKGIEFDSVYIILDGLKKHSNDDMLMKKRFFVMITRAINRLVFFKGVSCKKEIAELLPTDENILKRDVL